MTVLYSSLCTLSPCNILHISTSFNPEYNRAIQQNMGEIFMAIMNQYNGMIVAILTHVYIFGKIFLSFFIFCNIH